MFQALPVVIPTLRDIARGTLRPAEPADDAQAAAEAHTGAILLDARAPGIPALGALYDELELYLQAANIASLRLHRRGERTVTQMLDILAGVTLLRSHGCQRVILVVAAEGTLPSWERARAETLASLLDLVRRQHSGTARELIGAIADLVKTIRVVADSVTGVATILVPAAAPGGSHGSHGSHGSRSVRAAWRSQAAVQEPSSQPDGLPKALMLPLREGDDRVRAVSQLYLWCRELAGATPAPIHTSQWTPTEARAPEIAARSTALTGLRAASTEFHDALRWLDEQWSAIVGDTARQIPHSAARILAASSLAEAVPPQIKAVRASRAAWEYLDGFSRLRWLELCRLVFAPDLVPASMATLRRVD